MKICLNSETRRRQNGKHFCWWCFEMHFLKWIWIKILLKYVPESRVSKTSKLVQIIACHQTGDKPLLELIMTQSNDAYMGHHASFFDIVIRVRTRELNDLNIVSSHCYSIHGHIQGSSWVWAQSVRGDVNMWRRLSLAEPPTQKVILGMTLANERRR